MTRHNLTLDWVIKQIQEMTIDYAYVCNEKTRREYPYAGHIINITEVLNRYGYQVRKSQLKGDRTYNPILMWKWCKYKTLDEALTHAMIRLDNYPPVNGHQV